MSRWTIFAILFMCAGCAPKKPIHITGPMLVIEPECLTAPVKLTADYRVAHITWKKGCEKLSAK